MTRALRGPALGVVSAIAVNAGMDAVGLADSSFASLRPLMLIFWAVAIRDRLICCRSFLATGTVDDRGTEQGNQADAQDYYR